MKDMPNSKSPGLYASPCRKQLAFDLNESRLKKNYPRPNGVVGQRYHKRAWTDVARFMTAKNFEHRQYSVYDSEIEMADLDVYEMVTVMARRMPWFTQCVDVIDVTDIGEYFDMTPFVTGLWSQLQPEHDNA